jgi:hypothetical protein
LAKGGDVVTVKDMDRELYDQRKALIIKGEGERLSKWY